MLTRNLIKSKYCLESDEGNKEWNIIKKKKRKEKRIKIGKTDRVLDEIESDWYQFNLLCQI